MENEDTPMRRLALFCLTLGLFFPTPGAAENWPAWRGPRGDGSSAETNLPTEWDGQSRKNIKWRVDIPGKGHASPIVWNDRIFMVSCLPETLERVLICLDRDSGKQLWQKTVFVAPLESIHALNSRASATPVTDGKSIFVTFQEVGDKQIPAPNVGSDRLITAGEMVVASFDFDGNLNWLTKPGEFISAHGFSNCPVLFEDMVIVNGDHDGNSYVVALNKKTGKQVWREARDNGIRSYVTPLIRKIDGKHQMVFSGSEHIISLDPHNGSRHWKIEGPTEQFVASMVYHNGLFFMNCGYPDHYVMGIRPDGKGDVTETHVAWESRSARSYVPSPVALDQYLLVSDDRGTANCFDTQTGTRHWIARLGRGFSASLVHANGLVYFTDDDGLTTIVRPDKELQVVAKNELSEPVSASPALSDGQIFLRTETGLYCIEQQ